jgi:LuxR family transcriptional regulator, maltose regulon positive regulatory protein
MPVSVLSTKLYIPPGRENAVARPHLIEKLSSGVDRPGSFTLVAGPAGFGKTSLLSAFVSRLEWPVAWVSLDEGDNDAIQFWTYLITACRSILENVGESALELFNTQQPLPDETVPTILINDLSTHDQSIVLILDDYHAIQSPSIHAGLQFLLEHLPHNLHLILSTRSDPPWPLARFRARNQLIEIRSQDLRFSVQEASEFLNCTMALDLADEQVTALEERTEGWIAGLQLAAIALQSLASMQGRSDIPAFVKAFTGSHLYVAEYLVEEVLQRLPDDIRKFLLETSVLKRMNARLCEAVTGCQDGQGILRSLDHANTFIISLDHEGRWFRYHHLFADLLQARLQKTLSKDEIAALHLRAATWYEQNGYMVEAVQHAFSAGDYEKAALLVDRAGQTMIFTDQHNILDNWLDVLPDKMIQSHPRLQIYRLLIDLSKGTLDMYEQTLLEKEKLIKSLPASPQNDYLRRLALVHLSLFYAFQNTSRAIQIAQDALAEVPEGDVKMRAYLYSSFYRAYGMEGDVEKAAQAYRESFRLAEAAGQYGMISNTTMIRAFDLCQYGRLDEAAKYCQMVINAGSRSKQKVFYPAGPSYIGLAGIQLERNDLEKAGEYLTRGLELCHQGAMHGLFTGYVQKSRLLQAKGKLEESLNTYLDLEQIFQRREFTLMARQVAIRLAVGDLAGASDLVPILLEILGKSSYAQILPLIAAESFKLSLARIYIAQGEVDQANQLLDEIETTVESGKRFGRLMEVYLLRALALQKQSSGKLPTDSMTNLERALDLAEAPGFIMLFLEEGPALIPLLKAVSDRRDAPGRIKNYARKLLDAFGGIGKSAVSGLALESAELVEQLTRREMEVLELLAAGDSNRAIAEKLVITVRTVKKHTGNIYGKLNVNSRIQAVARAREVGLLSTD